MNLGPFLTFDDTFAQNCLKSSILADIATERAKSRYFQFFAVKPFSIPYFRKGGNGRRKIDLLTKFQNGLVY